LATFARRAAPYAGPLLIVLSVLIVDAAFVFGGLLTNQHEDVVGLTLPTYCFLGKSLASGHIPLWNPFTLSGTPFAADPQSGWAYLPAMLLFSTMSCGRAMRWYVTLQPIIAGLGIYAFLRSERLSRVAATVGGLALALVMAISYIELSIAFSAAIAWTAVLLATASRLFRAERWPARLGWLAATAVAGGQLAAAYASDGLALGFGALLAYVIVRVIGDLRAGRSWKLELGLIGMLAVAAPLVNLAYIAPRIGYLSRATAAFGYANLLRLQSHLTGVPFPPYKAPGSPSIWPLGMVVAPGSYVAVAALVLAFAAFFGKRVRALAIAFASFGLVSYVLSTDAFARYAKAHLTEVPFIDFYLHDPRRFRYGVIIAACVMAGLGMQAFLDAGSARMRAIMLAPGALVWLVLPFAFGVSHSWVWVFGLIAGGIALAVAWRRPVLAAVVPAVVAIEMVASGLSGQTVQYAQTGLGVASQDPGSFAPLRGPSIDAGGYVTRDQFASKIIAAGGGRYVTYAPNQIAKRDGYLPYQTIDYNSLEANGRGMIFGIEDVSGYNSVAPFPYWAYSREADPKPIRYNLTFYRHLTPQMFDLMDVRWVIGSWSPGDEPVPGLVRTLSDGRRVLWRVTGRSLDMGEGPREPERASFVPSWKTVRTAGAARDAVTAEDFDPRAVVVVQGDPGLGSSPPPAGASSSAPVGTVQVVSSERQTLDLEVEAPAPGLVLVRIPWDPHWSATVDGRGVAPLKADAFLMAVPVPKGAHAIRLAYADSSVGLGVLGSFLVLGAIGGGAVFLAARERRRRGPSRHRAPARQATAMSAEQPETVPSRSGVEPRPPSDAATQADDGGATGGGRGGSGRSPDAKR
jgi:hypothetical protein